MFFKKSGFPEEDELVLCTVSKVQFHSVFCDMDEYDNKSGMIHISEVSPGRIRNIRDYVKEGKKIVCIILKINQERGHIDLSLRRVNEGQRRRKLDGIKQEQKAERIIESLSKELKKDFKTLYKAISEPILKEYEMVHMAFNEVVESNLKLESLGIDKKLSEKLTKAIKDKIKPKEVEISGTFKVSSYEENGLEVVKTALQSADDVDKRIEVKYEGGGRYIIRIVASDYKIAEKLMGKATTEVKNKMEKTDGDYSFERHDK